MDQDKMCSPTHGLFCNQNPSVSIGVYLEVSSIAKRYQDIRVDARIMFFDMVLPLVLFNLKIVSEQRYPKGACPRSIFFPHCFFKRGFIQGVVASLLCNEPMQVNLYFIIFSFSFSLNLR